MAAPYFSNRLRLFPEYRQRVALYSAYRQRVGDTSSVAAAKLSVSARHAKRAWLEPCSMHQIMLVYILIFFVLVTIHPSMHVITFQYCLFAWLCRHFEAHNNSC